MSRRRSLVRGTTLRGLAAALLSILLSPVAAPPLIAQQAQPDIYAGFEGQNVSSVEIAARHGMNDGDLRKLIRQQSGKPFSIDAIRASVAALRDTQLFTEVQVSIEPRESGLSVLFILQPADYVGVIEFDGTGTKFPYPQLLQATSIQEQAAYVPQMQQDGQKGLEDFFRKQGFFAATSRAEAQYDEQHRVVNLTFHCVLNKQTRIRKIVFTGLSQEQDTGTLAALRSLWASLKRVSLKPGQKYSEPRIVKSIDFVRDHLRKQNQLAPGVRSEATDYDPATNRVDVTFTVTPGPRVSVRVAGTRVSQRALRRLIPIYEEDAVDQDLIDEGERNLRSYLQTKGYFDATVDSHKENNAGMIDVTYEIDRGSRHHLKSVDFDGNHYFSDKQLATNVLIKRGMFFSHGTYSQQLLAKGVASITQLYKDAGFAKVSVSPKVQDFEPELDVVIDIAEGPQDKVAAVQVVRSDGRPVQPLTRRRPSSLAPGKPFSPKLLEADRSRLLASYLDLGYLNADVRTTVSPAPDDPHSMNVTYTVTEGVQGHVSDVVLLGEKHTQPQYIDRIIRAQIQSGQPLSASKFLQAQSDLYDLGIFDWSTVGPLRPLVDQDQEEVLVKVHESPLNSMDIGGGLEIIPRDGNIPVNAVAVPGIPPVSLGNKFTVSQKSYIGPRFVFDFTRHNLRGRAETATIGTVLSRLDQRGFATYTDPHLKGSSWSSLISISGERTTQNPIYTAELEQASLQLEKALNKRKSQNLIVRYSYQHTALSNILIPGLVLPEDQRVRLSTFEGEYVRDSRDNPLDAHHGIYQAFDFGITPKVLGSSADFVRFVGQTAFYRPVKPWLVWATNFRLGLAAPFSGSDVPLSERFFSGGADSLRGFPINGAGPQRPVPVCSNPADPATCTLISVPVGGDMLFIFNTEARFPLPMRKNLGGVLFYDGGNVYANINLRQFAENFTHSVGLGFRYQTPVGPIRFDVGYRLTSVSGVQKAQYFVTLGQSF